LIVSEACAHEPAPTVPPPRTRQVSAYTIVDSLYPIGYGGAMYEIRRSTAFDSWLTNLNDSTAKARIAARIDRLALGNPGDVKPVGDGVNEMRIDYGPGYRVYYARTDRIVYLLLCGGTKATQAADIKRAIEMNAARARAASSAVQRKPKKRK